MKKLFVLLLFSKLCFAQNDSLAIKNANWTSTNIGKGIKWKSYLYKQKELFNGNQSINMIETRLKNRKVKFGFLAADSMKADNQAKRLLLPTSKIANNYDALVAVNAGFFDTKNGGAVDFLKIGKTVIDTTRLKDVPRLPFHTISAVTIHKNKLKIIKGKSEIGWERGLKEANVLLTGPLLRLNNVSEILPKTPFNDNRHPRTCACVTNDKKLLLITVDGRSSEAFGMTLAELAYLTKILNCKDAINFDGGGSTTLYIKGQPENGVVNYPSDNKLFDHAGERSVSNIFYLKLR
jgi:exopolysaccharide biosynthesis protein